MSYYLSKSKILSGRQCPKRLYLEIHKPEAAEPSASAQRVLNRGLEVHEVARVLYHGGRLIGHDEELATALKETEEALRDWQGEPLFEATMAHEGVLVRADVLLKDEKGVQLIEVKSSTKVWDYHVEDAAIQTWILRGQGIEPDSVTVAVVDSSFVYSGGGDYRGLFRNEIVTDQVMGLIGKAPDWVAELRLVLDGPEPDIKTGKQCGHPFVCPFRAYCSKDVEQPEYPVSILPNWGHIVEQLTAEGYADIRDVPEDRLRNPTHRRIREASLSGLAKFDAAVGPYLRALPYPRYYLDFEAIDFVVPMWPNTSPYQHIPFQWSCHIEDGPGSVTHKAFLHDGPDCPAQAVAETLLEALGDTGPIFVYSPYEARIIRGLGGILPDINDKLLRLIPRLEDLWPIAKKHYYHPSMKGSWSIKALLRAVSPDVSHADLVEVQDGTAAQMAFVEMIASETPDDRRAQLRERLLKYCELDTLALLKLADFFQTG